MIDSFSTVDFRKSAKQLYRYGLVGIASNLSGYLLFLLITYWGVEPKKAMTMLYVMGATIGFFGNQRWSFAYNGTLIGSGVRYFMAHLLGYLINYLMLLALVDCAGYAYQWIQAAAIIVVSIFLFLSFKYIVFPDIDGREKDAI